MSDTELDAEQQRGLNIVILKVAEARMNEAYNAFRYASDNATTRRLRLRDSRCSTLGRDPGWTA